MHGDTAAGRFIPPPSRIAGVLRAYRELTHGFAPAELERQTHAVALIAALHPRPSHVCDLATHGAIAPALHELLGIPSILTTGYPSDTAPRELVFLDASGAERHRFRHDRFDIEEPFPYSDDSFDLVVFTEVLEHLSRDPMHTLSEINRVTRVDGCLLLSTPNCVSLRSVLNALRGGHPYVWAPYSRSGHRDRHNREYTPAEVAVLLSAAGYDVRDLHCRSVYESGLSRSRAMMKRAAARLLDALRRLLHRGARADWSGDTIFAVAQKTSPVRDRFPGFLYY